VKLALIEVERLDELVVNARLVEVIVCRAFIHAEKLDGALARLLDDGYEVFRWGTTEVMPFFAAH
jgi:hypothetical protein